MTAVVNSWIVYCELKHQKTPLLDFIVPLAEALMASGKLNAQYQRRRGTGRPSKTSRSLLNVGDHLPNIQSKVKALALENVEIGDRKIRIKQVEKAYTNSKPTNQWSGVKRKAMKAKKQQDSRGMNSIICAWSEIYMWKFLWGT
ncbi:piggyBac transposable element-derived protein 4 [Nephila pilipes]|uniref:PiggyBac transposable element-derived protein 4 n=1 Tax=Nephila pilipes TaxID=299642 RepID=A0A8X6PFP2_NEPPI|nr:piggyBac transposable element-derived protein 4 [Nephila pilipes]